MQTGPPVDFLLSNGINKIHSLKYLRSTTLGSKVSKKALVYKPQRKCFQDSCLGLKKYQKVRQMLNFF